METTQNLKAQIKMKLGNVLKFCASVKYIFFKILLLLQKYFATLAKSAFATVLWCIDGQLVSALSRFDTESGLQR